MFRATHRPLLEAQKL